MRGIATGGVDLNAVLPVLAPGHLWSVIAARGGWATELCLTIARRAGRDPVRRQVVFANDHVTSEVLRERLGPCSNADVDFLEALALPGDQSAYPFWTTSAGARVTDLVVYDTLDASESVEPVPERGEAIARMRLLRATARAQNTAVLTTFRVAPDESDAPGINRAWRRHPWHEAAMDAADVIVMLSEGQRYPSVRFVVDSRTARRNGVTIKTDPVSGKFVVGG